MGQIGSEFPRTQNESVEGLVNLADSVFSQYPLLPADVFALANLADADQFSAYPIAAADLEAQSVTAAKLAAAIAGAGLTGGAGSALAVGAGSAITVNANDVAVDAGSIPVTDLGVGTVADGEFVQRSGASLVGGTPSGGTLSMTGPTDVSGSRSPNTWYQNTTGDVQVVYVWESTANVRIIADINSTQTGQQVVAASSNAQSGSDAGVTLLVPDNYYWRVTNGVTFFEAELQVA